MDLWIFLGFVAVIAFLAKIEQTLLALQKDIIETKVKMDYVNSAVLKSDLAGHKLPGNIDAKESHPAFTS